MTLRFLIFQLLFFNSLFSNYYSPSINSILALEECKKELKNTIEVMTLYSKAKINNSILSLCQQKIFADYEFLLDLLLFLQKNLIRMEPQERSDAKNLIQELYTLLFKNQAQEELYKKNFGNNKYTDFITLIDKIKQTQITIFNF